MDQAEKEYHDIQSFEKRNTQNLRRSVLCSAACASQNSSQQIYTNLSAQSITKKKSHRMEENLEAL